MVWKFKWFIDKTRNDELKKLTKQGNNSTLESIMKNLTPLDLIDSSSSTLLHSAIKCNNIDLIKFLLESGSPINSQNASGQTPLMFAVIYDRFQAIKLLLEADANIYISDSSGKTPLQIAIKHRVPNFVIEYFYKNLKKIEAPTERIADVFEAAGCSLSRIFSLNDSDLLEAMLQRERSIGIRESCVLVQSAMKLASTENVRSLIVLIRVGIGSHFRKGIFLRELAYRIEDSSPNFDYVKRLFKKLISLNAIDEDLVRYFEKVFNKKKTKAVQLLLDCKIHIHVNEHFGRNLVTHLFGNRNANSIMKRSENQLISQMIWDQRGRRGFTALHFAVEANLNRNVRWLLERSPIYISNSRDDRGMTPLFFAKNVECVELLLQNDADIQAINADGLTIFDVNQCWIIRRMLIAHMTCLESQAVMIKQAVRDSIGSNEKLTSFYDKCRSQIELMKDSIIFNVVSLFTVLTEKAEMIARYIRYKDNATIDLKLYKRQLHWYYYSKLKHQLEKVRELHRLYSRAAAIVAESIGLFGPEHLVVEKIVSYLSYEDMLVFE